MSILKSFSITPIRGRANREKPRPNHLAAGSPCSSSRIEANTQSQLNRWHRRLACANPMKTKSTAPVFFTRVFENDSKMDNPGGTGLSILKLQTSIRSVFLSFPTRARLRDVGSEEHTTPNRICTGETPVPPTIVVLWGGCPVFLPLPRRTGLG